MLHLLRNPDSSITERICPNTNSAATAATKSTIITVRHADNARRPTADLGVAGGERQLDLHRRRSVRPAGHQHAQGRRDDMAGDPDTPLCLGLGVHPGAPPQIFQPGGDPAHALHFLRRRVRPRGQGVHPYGPGPTTPCSGGLSVPTTTTPRCTRRPTCC